MTRALIILPEAEEELEAAIAWYHAQARLGADFLATVDGVLEEIAARPESFACWPGRARFRRAPVPHYPYLVVFELRGAELEVVAVAHTRRRPGDWAARVLAREEPREARAPRQP